MEDGIVKMSVFPRLDYRCANSSYYNLSRFFFNWQSYCKVDTEIQRTSGWPKQSYERTKLGLPCWLGGSGSHLPMQETWVWPLIQENPACRRATQPGAEATAPVFCSPPAAAGDARCPKAGARRQEKPLERGAHTPQWRPAPARCSWRKPMCNQKWIRKIVRKRVKERTKPDNFHDLVSRLCKAKLNYGRVVLA